jgi:hypothetical protein
VDGFYEYGDEPLILIKAENALRNEEKSLSDILKSTILDKWTYFAAFVTEICKTAVTSFTMSLSASVCLSPYNIRPAEGIFMKFDTA